MFLIGLDLEPRGEKEGDIYRCEIDAGGCDEYFRTALPTPKCPNCESHESVYKYELETKKCSNCFTEKSLSEFYTRKKKNGSIFSFRPR